MAPAVPAWLDCTKGALSCQHTSVDSPLIAPVDVILRREGTGGVLNRVKAGIMKVEKWTRTTAVKRILGSVLGCETCEYELAAACTVNRRCRAMTAGYRHSFLDRKVARDS